MSFRARFRLLIVLTLLLIALTTFAVGKYITTIQKPGTVTFNAKLAENVMLVESRITRKADGTYETTSETITGAQSYTLIPGLDVPKDPHIVITGKTNIPAHLYIEVVDNTPNEALRYNLISKNWISSSRTAKVAGAAVYVYSTDGSNPAQITTDQTEIFILQDNKIYVDQGLLSDDESNGLTFYAYLEEAVPTNP